MASLLKSKRLVWAVISVFTTVLALLSYFTGARYLAAVRAVEHTMAVESAIHTTLTLLVDAETGHGLITDVALKRKLRNFVQLVKGAQPPYDIYIKEKAVLEQTHRKAYEAIGAEAELAGDDDPKAKKKRKGSADSVDKAREALWLSSSTLACCSTLRDASAAAAACSSAAEEMISAPFCASRAAASASSAVAAIA